jgi:hypothetical protein
MACDWALYKRDDRIYIEKSIKPVPAEPNLGWWQFKRSHHHKIT